MEEDKFIHHHITLLTQIKTHTAVVAWLSAISFGLSLGVSMLFVGMAVLMAPK